jgi:hypothetical protein
VTVHSRKGQPNCLNGARPQVHPTRDPAYAGERGTAPRLQRPPGMSGFYRIGENAAGITNAFSCFTTTPGGFRAGH